MDNMQQDIGNATKEKNSHTAIEHLAKLAWH